MYAAKTHRRCPHGRRLYLFERSMAPARMLDRVVRRHPPRAAVRTQRMCGRLLQGKSLRRQGVIPRRSPEELCTPGFVRIMLAYRSVPLCLARTADHAKDCGDQPEGRGRQDHHRGQSRGGPGADGPARAAGGPRPAGPPEPAPGRRAQPGNPDHLPGPYRNAADRAGPRRGVRAIAPGTLAHRSGRRRDGTVQRGRPRIDPAGPTVPGCRGSTTSC